MTKGYLSPGDIGLTYTEIIKEHVDHAATQATHVLSNQVPPETLQQIKEPSVAETLLDPTIWGRDKILLQLQVLKEIKQDIVRHPIQELKRTVQIHKSLRQQIEEGKFPQKDELLLREGAHFVEDLKKKQEHPLQQQIEADPKLKQNLNTFKSDLQTTLEQLNKDLILTLQPEQVQQPEVKNDPNIQFILHSKQNERYKPAVIELHQEYVQQIMQQLEQVSHDWQVLEPHPIGHEFLLNEHNLQRLRKE